MEECTREEKAHTHNTERPLQNPNDYKNRKYANNWSFKCRNCWTEHWAGIDKFDKSSTRQVQTYDAQGVIFQWGPQLHKFIDIWQIRVINSRLKLFPQWCQFPHITPKAKLKITLCRIIYCKPAINCSMASASSDMSSSGSDSTLSNLLDALVNQPLAPMRRLWPASAAEIPPVWVPVSFKSSVGMGVTLTSQLTPPRVPGEPTDLAQIGFLSVVMTPRASWQPTRSQSNLTQPNAVTAKNQLNNVMPFKTRLSGSTTSSQHALCVYSKQFARKLKMQT